MFHMYFLTHSLILVNITFSHFFWAKVTLIGTTSCVHSVLSKSLFTPFRVYTHNTSNALPIFGFQGGPWMIANYPAKSTVSPITVYMELQEISPLLFQHCNILWVVSPVF